MAVDPGPLVTQDQIIVDRYLVHNEVTIHDNRAVKTVTGDARIQLGTADGLITDSSCWYSVTSTRIGRAAAGILVAADAVASVAAAAESERGTGWHGMDRHC